MSETVYLVEGETGDYDNYAKWVVCGYLSKGEAEAHASAAGEEADKIVMRYRSGMGYEHGTNPYDPDMLFSGDVVYSVVEIELRSIFSPAGSDA